jgi:hypothetical protein
MYTWPYIYIYILYIYCIYGIRRMDRIYVWRNYVGGKASYIYPNKLHPSIYLSGCPIQERGRPLQFDGPIIIGKGFYFGAYSATRKNNKTAPTPLHKGHWKTVFS